MTTPNPLKVTSQELEQLHATFCNKVGKQNTWLKNVFPFSIMTRTPVELEDIYIVPRLVKNAPKWDLRKERIDKGLKRGTPDTVEEDLLKKEIEQTLKEVLFRTNHMVILGKPGVGKTLLLQYIALKASTNPEVLGIDQLVPIQIPLGEYNGMNKDKTLKEFIFHCIKDQLCNMSEDIFEFFLERNLLIFLFDGLHEVVSISERVEVSRQVEKLMAMYPRTRMVLTSRPSGYNAAALIGAIPHYSLAEFNDKEIEEFLEKWTAFQRKNEEFVGSSGEKVQLAITVKEGILELARNPLLLTILGFIHKNGKKSPVEKWEFYQYAMETMIDIVETWKIHDRKIPHREVIIAVLEKVGFNLHSEELENCDDETFCTWVKEVLDDKQGHSSRKEIDGIVWMLKEVGLLTEKKQEFYEIAHESFQEFFTAQYISRRKDMVHNLITKAVHTSHWREVFLLAAAIAPPKQADMIFDSILNAENDFEGYTHSNLLAAGEALTEEGRVSESKRTDIMHRLKGLTRSGNIELRLEALQTLMKLRDVFKFEYMKDLLSKEWYIRYLAVKHASTMRAGNADMRTLVFELLNDKDWRIRREVIKYFAIMKARNTDIREKIFELLKDEVSYIRIEAVKYFTLLGDKDTRVQKAIFGLLRDETPDVCVEAVEYFTILDDGDIEIWREFFELLRDEDSYVRYLALKYFSAIDGEKTKGKFFELLRDEDSYVRYLALTYFTAIGGDCKITERIFELLRDNDRRIRYQAFEYLITRGDNIQITEKTFELLRDNDRRIRYQALEYLTTRENPEIKKKVFELLSAEYSYVREQAVKYFTIIRARDMHIKKRIFELLSDESDTRYFAVEYLAAIGEGDTEIEEKFFEFLSDRDWRVRYVAVEFYATRGNGNQEIDKKILALLRDEDPDVRYRAVRYFTTTSARDTEIKKEICELLKDEYSYIRYRAVEYLTTGKMEDPEIKDILIALLRDEDSGVRCLAAEYATRIGLKDTETKKNVFELLRDEDSDVREQAMRYFITTKTENPEINRFSELLQDEDPDVCCCALRYFTITRTGNTEIRKRIFELLSDESYSPFLEKRVQTMAVEYLSRYARKESLVRSPLLFTSQDESTRRGSYNLMKALVAQ